MTFCTSLQARSVEVTKFLKNGEDLLWVEPLFLPASNTCMEILSSKVDQSRRSIASLEPLRENDEYAARVNIISF